MLRNLNEPRHLHHEEVIGAILKRLPVIRPVDVVLDLNPTHRILIFDLCRWNLVDAVIDRPKTRQRFSFGLFGEKGER